MTVTLLDKQSERLFGCTDNTLYNKLLQSDNDKKQLSLLLQSSYVGSRFRKYMLSESQEVSLGTMKKVIKRRRSE